jgi:exonuclease III
MFLRILTWNTNYKDHTKPQKRDIWARGLGNFLQMIDADIIFLQETKPQCFYDFLPNYNIFYHEVPNYVEYSSTSPNVCEQNTFFTIPGLDIFTPNLPPFLKQKARHNDYWWGSSIIIKKTYKFISQYFFNSCYVGYDFLMCYEFEIIDGKRIILVNIYGKNDRYFNLSCHNTTMHRMLSDISPIINKQYGKIIILAGDFNVSTQDEYKNNKYQDILDKPIFDRLDDFGLVNCTVSDGGKHLKTLFYDGYPQLDYIFINKNNYNEKINKPKLYDELYGNINLKELSDHIPIELKIEI